MVLLRAILTQIKLLVLLLHVRRCQISHLASRGCLEIIIISRLTCHDIKELHLYLGVLTSFSRKIDSWSYVTREPFPVLRLRPTSNFHCSGAVMIQHLEPRPRFCIRIPHKSRLVWSVRNICDRITKMSLLQI